jgi:hypothetical protein
MSIASCNESAILDNGNNSADQGRAKYETANLSAES